ncbi:MAG: hemerythrin domain-containing protein [Acidobacteria bacterium]|nr:hemerythrin domain-containing protein [Acidobacteriota bacterium]
MRTTPLASILILTAAVSAPIVPFAIHAQSRPPEVARIEIPESIRHEHDEIHSTLVEATKASGGVGTAARALAKVLDPHFVREEQIALPPLGLLAPLSAGTVVTEAVKSEALKMTDALRRELPRMLEEHQTIRKAVEGLRQAAVAENAQRYQQLAEQLAHHAQTEEEVLYPTAVLVGDLLRARPAAR